MANLDNVKAKANETARRTNKQPKVPTAFDWNSYRTFTEGMSMFRKRQMHFAYISYDHWLNPGNLPVETYEESLMHAIDDEAEVRNSLAKLARKRIVTHTVEQAAAIRRCAEYAAEVAE